MTADPLAGDDDDHKFELTLATFSNQTVRRPGSRHSPSFFEAVFFVLSAAGTDTPILEPTE